jgi:hypothetical protein
MRIIGRWEPKQEPVDNRKYVAHCQNSRCRSIVEFRGYNIKYIHKEGEEYKGEFGMICKKMDRYFYAITCPGCNELIWLGDDERTVINHLKSGRERDRAIRKYDDEHDVDYD